MRNLRSVLSWIIGLFLGLATTMQIAGGPAAAWAQDELFVTNCGSGAVLVFARTANANTAPLRTLQGPATGLACPQGVVVDPVNNELLVASFPSSIRVFSRTASGNAAPLRTLEGPALGLISPSILSVDPLNNELFVSRAFAAPFIAVFARTASGNTAPLRTLQPATALGVTRAVAVDPVNDELLVASVDSITVYPRTASGNAAPLRTLEGPATGLNNPSALFVDQVNDELAVSNFANPPPSGSSLSSVRVYARTADGNTAPLRRIFSPGLVGPLGLAVDAVNNELLVVKSRNGATFSSSSPPCGIANSIPAGVMVFPRTANGELCPLRHLTAFAAGLFSPQFLAVTTSASTLSLSARVNQSTFAVGQTLSASGGVVNPGLPGAADFYVGILKPDNSIEFFTDTGIVIGSLADLTSFRPLATGVSLSAPFSVDVPNFYSHQWTGADQHGSYTFFVFALKANALIDGVVTADEVLGIAAAPFQFP